MSEPPPVNKFNQYVQGFLAIFITLGFFGVIVGLMLLKDIPAAVKDILLVMLGALLASYKELTSYFFGSSSGSASKDTALAAAAAAPSAPAQVTVVSSPPPAPIAPAPTKVDPTLPAKPAPSPSQLP